LVPHGRALIRDRVFISFFEKQLNVTGSTRLENGCVPGFEKEIIHVKELCTHVDIVDEKLSRRPLFCNAALRMGAIKEDQPLLIRTLTRCNVIISKWGYLLIKTQLFEEGCLFEKGRLLEGGC